MAVSNPTELSAGGDELDDLFNYDIDVDAAFRELEDKANAARKSEGDPKQKPEADLGIDEEVQVKAARKPVPKLDQQRLLSERGIPKLRKLAKDKLRFKGKGHEFKDVARMLNLYQLWLDDLYPRAKFLDSLAMVEKLGHTKSMQFRRKDWINECKPRDSWQDGELSSHPENDNMQAPAASAELSGPVVNSSEGLNNSNVVSESNKRPSDPNQLFLSEDEDEAGVPDEDELDALLAEEPSGPRKDSQLEVPILSQDSLRTSPVREDELDALWAEHEADVGKENRPIGDQHKHDQPVSAPPQADEFADEMEAMADFDMW